MIGLGVQIGATAPTTARLEMVKDALMACARPDWYAWSERHQRFTSATGNTIQLLATKKHSEAVGEKTQGYNWAAHMGDEIQDTTQVAEDGIEMRGRTAPRGEYKRINTASVKDSAEWRSRRDFRLKSGLWSHTRLVGPENPFTWQRFWDEKKQLMSAAAYQRRVLAMDVPPEDRVYTAWDREHSLRRIPRDWRDCTEQVLRKAAGQGRYSILVGHDPGEVRDVSVMLKAYRIPGMTTHVWVIVDELTTERTTTEQHCHELLKRLATKWHCNVPNVVMGQRAHVRIDPHGNSENKPHKSVHAQFRRLGFDAKAAAYNDRGQGVGRVPIEAGVEMVNRLLCAADGTRRLFVACDERRQPHATKLVTALEQFERDAAGKAKGNKSNKKLDLSDWPRALTYALWRFERLTATDYAWKPANG